MEDGRCRIPIDQGTVSNSEEEAIPLKPLSTPRVEGGNMVVKIDNEDN